MNVNHKSVIRRMFVFCLMIFIFFSGCQKNGQPPEFTSQIAEEIPDHVDREFSLQVLNKYRPTDATKTPDFSGDIQDIRITVVPREYVGQTTGIDAIDARYRNLTSLQIYYGYLSDGQWYDIPCENYDLKGIFDDVHDYTGFDAAGNSHIVKIGPYLVICIRHYSADAPQWATFCTIEDTLGSQATQQFEEYYTQSVRNDGVHGYGYFKEDPASVIAGDVVNFVARDTFDLYYYVVLDYDTLPENYELSVIFWEGLMNYRQTLTYDEIVSLLEK